MIIIPRERPILENLNSFYLNIRRLIEYCRGELGSGGIHFKSTESEGVVFFDKEGVINSIFQDKKEVIKGKETLNRLIEASVDIKFNINVFKIDPDWLYFWANIPAAKEIYRNLGADFTDLKGLIIKMNVEGFTGYIDVSIANGQDGGLIFFNQGEIVGGSYSWGGSDLNRSKENLELLIQKTKESGGIFNVFSISMTREEREDESKETEQKRTVNIISALEELLIISEKVFTLNKKIKGDFPTLLKKKFREKASRYPFLDPFSADFEYVEKKIALRGNINDEELTQGVIECVKEMANEFGILTQLKNELAPWTQKYGPEIDKFGISF